MANTKKDKTAEVEVKEVVKEKDVDKINELEELVKKQQEQMQEMAKLMEDMKNTNQSTIPVVQMAQTNDLSNRKIKVVSCLHCWLNLTTEEKGGGIKFEFPHFGYKHNIRFETLEKCVHNHRACAERGDFYICDPEAVAELDLSDAYSNLYNVDEIENIIQLKNGENDVDKIVGMSKFDKYKNEYVDTEMRDNAIKKIAENIANGEKYDLNLIASLTEKTGVDIDTLIEQAKEIINIKKEDL